MDMRSIFYQSIWATIALDTNIRQIVASQKVLLLLFTHWTWNKYLWSRMNKFSHIDQHGLAAMVDVSAKEVTARTASAEAYVKFPDAVFESLHAANFGTAKGAVAEVAKIAGIQAAKRCSDWIPMCHPLLLSKIQVDIDVQNNPVRIVTEVKCEGKTGVEMEALTAASAAALTIYDMCKALSHEIIIQKLQLLSKTGGKSDFNASEK